MNNVALQSTTLNESPIMAHCRYNSSLSLTIHTMMSVVILFIPSNTNGSPAVTSAQKIDNVNYESAIATVEPVEEPSEQQPKLQNVLGNDANLHDDEQTYLYIYDDRPYWSIIDLVLAAIMLLTFLYASFFVVAITGVGKRKDTNYSHNEPRGRQRKPKNKNGNNDTNGNNSFNLYLFFIILPDILYNCITGIAQFYEGIHDGKYPPNFPLCEMRMGFSFFYYFTNLYLNAVLAYEIYTIVVNSYRRRHTNPPSIRKVYTQVGLVYLFTTLLSLWFIINVPWSPFGFENMTYCITKSGSPTADKQLFSESMGSLIAICIVLPPFIYVFYVGFKVWYNALLPIKGRTRAISLYFFRIVLVFICFYIPNLAIAAVLSRTF